MARERLNAIDVGVVVANLKRLALNYSLVNIYDITNRIFVLKFSKNEEKVYVLIEIGCRIHTTQFLRSSDRLPSNFNVKLRKHLRSRKLRNVAQMSQDRVIDFTFSSEEYAHHLIVQLFLPGNIYLTDANYKVLTVLSLSMCMNVGTLHDAMHGLENGTGDCFGYTMGGYLGACLGNGM